MTRPFTNLIPGRRRAGGRGFTLVETLVAIAIFSVLMLTITQIIVGGLRAWQMGRNEAQLRSDAKNAMDQIAADFHMAVGPVLVPSAAVVAGVTPTLSSELQFTRLDSLSNQHQITYQIVGTQLIRTDQNNSSSGPAITQLVANNVALQIGSSTASFFQFDPNEIINPDVNPSGVHDVLILQLTLLSDANPQDILANPSLIGVQQFVGVTKINRKIPDAPTVASGTSIVQTEASTSADGVTTQAISATPGPGDLADPRQVVAMPAGGRW